MKYKVGNMVKLRTDLIDDRYYGELKFITGMKQLQNNALKISRCDSGDHTYLTSDGWWITEEMIEGLWEECKPTEPECKSESTLIDLLTMLIKFADNNDKVDIINNGIRYDVVNGKYKEYTIKRWIKE